MRSLSLALMVVLLGCSRSGEPDLGSPGHPPEANAAHHSDQPWGGLQVESSGVALEAADQIVVLLHGYGSNARDLVQLGDYIGGDSRAFVYPTAPIANGRGGFAWATTQSEMDAAQAQLESLVRFVARSYPNAEIAVGGFSQGATLSSRLLTVPDLSVRHLLLYSPSLAVSAAVIIPGNDVRVLLAHGQQDDRVPFTDSSQLQMLLEQRGIDTNWLPFEGGHSITAEALDATISQLSEPRD